MPILILGVLAVVIYAIFRHHRLRVFRNRIGEIRQACDEFEKHMSADDYFNHSKLQRWLRAHSSLCSVVNSPVEYWRIGQDAKSLVIKLRGYLERHDELVREHNEMYVQRELEQNRERFDTLEKYPLNERQREAIVHDEDHNLVIAGAGTGKTSSIVGKVVYLVKSRKVPTAEILLLAFARKAKEEMVVRLTDKLGQDGVGLEVRTFHSLGRRIIGEVEGVAPELAFEEEAELLEFLADRFKEFAEDSRFAKEAIRYLAYYPMAYREQHAFKDFADFKKHHPPESLRTLQGETVKSMEEREIADCLFLNSVEYEYEAPYEYPTADAEHGQYKPDFRLPEFGIYIEHFGIDRQSRVPKWFAGVVGRSASEVYSDGINWKRGLHKEHRTILVETYSYERKEGTLLDGLREKLAVHGVAFTPRDSEEVMKRIQETRAKAVPDLLRLVRDVLVLYRANGFKEADLRERVPQSSDPARSKAFIEVFVPLVQSYEKELASLGSIDFSDMISKATRYVREGRYVSHFRHILIDEFQDISRGRYGLIKAILDQKPDRHLYCVGDDWQSIYRFTGSDINVILDFEKHFGFTRTTVLDTTYRFYDRIAEVTGEFVQKNERQLRKELRTLESKPDEPLAIHLEGDDGASSLGRILHAIEGEARADEKTFSVYILGRYKFNKPANLTQLCNDCPNLRIEFHTAHGSKGLEADHVVIVRAVAGRHGFPSEIDDDPLLQLVLPEPETFEHAEERRLFYVAMTRARKKIHILTQQHKKSTFVEEIEGGHARKIKCPACEHGFLELKDLPNGPFWGCRNYPHCEYTMEDRDVERDGNLNWTEGVGQGQVCPRCRRAYLARRESRHGPFWGCTNWRPNGQYSCRYKNNINDENR